MMQFGITVHSVKKKKGGGDWDGGGWRWRDGAAILNTSELEAEMRLLYLPITPCKENGCIYQVVSAACLLGENCVTEGSLDACVCVCVCGRAHVCVCVCVFL